MFGLTSKKKIDQKKKAEKQQKKIRCDEEDGK